jgi:fibronectin type III domain protein
MIHAPDIVTPRFQLAVLAAILCQSLHPVAMPTIVSAAEQEPPSRHSLIHRSDTESASLPATTHGTILQPSGSEPTQITSPVEPHKPSVSVSPTPIPTPHHRTLTKRPPIATLTAPPASPQTPPAASVSGIADGQAAQTTLDTAKGTLPSATPPNTKAAAAATLPGTTPAASSAVGPTGSSPLAGAVGGQSSASAGSGSAPVSGGSRSAANVLRNSAISSLLAPATPVVTAPPSTPPPSTPPQTLPSTPPPSSPPPSPSTGSVTLTWAANVEPDLAGYKIYVGTNSGTYSFPGSPFVPGKVTSYTISNLPKGQTYYFAISAYDSAGNESGLSAEVSKTLY